MTPMNVIKSSTSIAANCLNLKNVGIIQENYVADIIIVEGNPLKNLQNLKY